MLECQLETRTRINVGAVLCDLSKAFDVINHEILPEKVHKYRKCRIVNGWFKGYLSERSQFVEVDNTKSTKPPIECGVTSSDLSCILFTSMT